MSNWREVLVVSSDEGVRQNLGGILRQRGGESLRFASQEVAQAL
jgi:hypothetical protein